MLRGFVRELTFFIGKFLVGGGGVRRSLPIIVVAYGGVGPREPGNWCAGKALTLTASSCCGSIMCLVMCCLLGFRFYPYVEASQRDLEKRYGEKRKGLVMSKVILPTNARTRLMASRVQHC